MHGVGAGRVSMETTVGAYLESMFCAISRQSNDRD
jgi:hypothetical protein